MNKSAFLNKSEAAHHLHHLYESFIDDNKLIDIHPNFQSLIHENVRNPKSMSAIAKGLPRGNRMTYGKIDTIRIGNRPYFARHTLDDWFNRRYAPKLSTASSTHLSIKPKATPTALVSKLLPISASEIDALLGDLDEFDKLDAEIAALLAA